jgi:cell filamentation protein
MVRKAVSIVYRKGSPEFRFYKDHEVRAIWDEEKTKWWFSVQDVVGAINDQFDYKKNRNYWKYLKTKLRKEENELVSATNQLKLRAADGKRYDTDVLDAEGIRLLAKYTNNQRAMDFLDWFTYSDNTIDGRSTRIWLDMIFKKRLGRCVDWSKGGRSMK